MSEKDQPETPQNDQPQSSPSIIEQTPISQMPSRTTIKETPISQMPQTTDSNNSEVQTLTNDHNPTSYRNTSSNNGINNS